MPISGLENNRMVSESAAAGAGFSLNAGKSHVSSARIMTKAAALDRYNLNGAQMSAYASNQLIPAGVWTPMGVVYEHFFYLGTASGTGTGSCSITRGTISTLYSLDATLTTGSVLYNDESLTSLKDGDGVFYTKTDNKAYRIGTNGAIISMESCAVSDITLPVMTNYPSVSSNGYDIVYVSGFTATDNVTAAALLRFYIYRIDYSSNITFVGEVGYGETFTDSVGVAGIYTYAAAAIDRSGNVSPLSDNSNEIEVILP